MRKKEIVRAVLFTIFSISAGIVQMGSFAILNELMNLRYLYSYGISLVLSIIWNFTLNRNVTFKAANNVPVAMVKVLCFYAVFTPTTMFLGDYLVEDLGVNEYLITGATMVLNFVLEYLYDRFFVFGKHIDTKNRKEA